MKFKLFELFFPKPKPMIPEPKVEPVYPIRPVVRKIVEMLEAGDFKETRDSWTTTWKFAFEKDLSATLSLHSHDYLFYYLRLGGHELGMYPTEYKLINDTLSQLLILKNKRLAAIANKEIERISKKIENYQVQDRKDLTCTTPPPPPPPPSFPRVTMW